MGFHHHQQNAHKCIHLYIHTCMYVRIQFYTHTHTHATHNTQHRHRHHSFHNRIDYMAIGMYTGLDDAFAMEIRRQLKLSAVLGLSPWACTNLSMDWFDLFVCACTRGLPANEPTKAATDLLLCCYVCSGSSQSEPSGADEMKVDASSNAPMAAE